MPASSGSKRDENKKLFFKAAKRILEADFLLVGTGAGYSADSGLSVYKDVANMQVYRDQKIDYSDLAHPSMLKKNEELFFGFWTKCFNDYQEAKLHDGYEILKRWKQEFFTSPFESRLRKRSSLSNAMEDEEKEEDSESENEEEEEEESDENEESEDNDNTFKELYSTQVQLLNSMMNQDYRRAEKEYLYPGVKSVAGPFFVFTSNVDGHFYRHFKRQEVIEIHGGIDHWQCESPCKKQVWSIPSSYRFPIDADTMTIQHDETTRSYLKCKHCGARARPNILLFDDFHYFNHMYNKAKYLVWEKTMLALLKKYPKKKLVVLEIGCGKTVPTVRNHSESLLRDLGRQCTVIRINPDDFELFEQPKFLVKIKRKPRTLKEAKMYVKEQTVKRFYLDQFIGIKSTTLHALQSIDSCIQRLKKHRRNK